MYLFLSQLPGAWCRFASCCILAGWSCQIFWYRFYAIWILGLYAFVHSVCLWTLLTWWLAVLTFIKKIPGWHLFKDWELWLLMDFCIILTGAFKFCLCFAVILHPRNNLHQWYLVPYSKGDIVLLQSLLSWIFFFTKASSLVSCYIHILLHCSYFAEWFFFYSGSITFCDSHPLGVWVLIHLLQTFPSFTGV